MATLLLTGKEIRAIGYPEGPVISVAMNVMEKHYKHHTKEDALAVLTNILAEPELFTEDEILGNIAKLLLPDEVPENNEIALLDKGVHFNIFGAEYIEESALYQMHSAAKLPVSLAGALMPDAHSGYGLPIGGVLATENAVIPYGVGVDIGCRMCLSVFDIHPEELTNRENYFTRELNEATLFGTGKRVFKSILYSEILDSPVFDEIPFVKGLQNKAVKQLGSSGSGNHFVEFGVVEIPHKDDVLGLEARCVFGLVIAFGFSWFGCQHCQPFYEACKRKKKACQKKLRTLRGLA